MKAEAHGKDDPVISRIRAARHAISQKCDHDPHKIVAYYMRLQQSHPVAVKPASKS